MTLESVISNIRDDHRDCCITGSYEDEGCRLDTNGLTLSLLAAFHGGNYQLNHAWTGRLCDRVIIGQSHGGFVCAVEFKGGNNIIMSVAIEQIQGGLDLAAFLLPTRSPEKWYPLLVYSGSMSGRERDLLRNKKVSYRGNKARVDRIDCGSSLLNYLVRQHRNRR